MLSKEEIEERIKYAKSNFTDGIEIFLEIIEKLEQENNKLSKMIDEMVDEYEYNARCNLNNFCDEEMRKDKCIQDCRICIKQYFEKKVGGELNES